MADGAVRTVAPDEAEQAIATLTLAFARDPMARWCFAEAGVYLRAFPEILRVLGRAAFEAGSAHRSGDFAGVALWIPPGAEPDEAALGAIVETSVPGDRMAAFAELMERMGAAHPPEPHWYLHFIGVDPCRQSEGRGSALLAHALDRCDAEGRAAHLETASLANVPLYRRHGFVETGVLQVGSSPALTTMLRRPRGRR